MKQKLVKTTHNRKIVMHFMFSCEFLPVLLLITFNNALDNITQAEIVCLIFDWRPVCLIVFSA